MGLEIFQVEVGLLRNFNELISDGRVCAVVDPAYEVDRLLREAAARGWRIESVLITHTHPDHIDGVDEMVRATGAAVSTLTGVADERVNTASANACCLHRPPRRLKICERRTSRKEGRGNG